SATTSSTKRRRMSGKSSFDCSSKPSHRTVAPPRCSVKSSATPAALSGSPFQNAPGFAGGCVTGKVERFFRTTRETFLGKSLDLSSIEALNLSFNRWVEDEYHTRQHSVLKMRPIDRFGLDLGRLRFLPPNEANDEFLRRTG